VEINRDKKNEAFTYEIVSPVITYQRWKLTGVAGKYSGRREMFCAGLFKNLTRATKGHNSVLCEDAGR
jgi:hypothetical protein